MDGDTERIDPAVLAYVEAVPAEHRPLFDRLLALVTTSYPDAVVGISYGMPTYRVGKRRLFLGTWAHGLSIYGWRQGGDAGFAARHPELRSGKGTIRIRPQDGASLADAELLELVDAALGG